MYLIYYYLSRVLLGLLAERQSVKGKMGGEDMINEDGSDCVLDWISVPDNTPETKGTRCSQKQ